MRHARNQKPWPTRENGPGAVLAKGETLMVKLGHSIFSRLFFAILSGWLLTVAGCYTNQVISASGLNALATQQSAHRLALRGENGSEVLVAPRTRVRFVRSDGSYTAWVRAKELWISDEGVLVRHRYPLPELQAVQIAGLDTEAVSLLLKSAPDGGTAVEMGQGTVVLQAPRQDLTKWVQAFVVAQAQERIPQVFRDANYKLDFFLTRDPARRFAKVLYDLRRLHRGDILGTWGLAVRADEWNWLSGQELVLALDDGLELLDGLRFSDVQTMQVASYDSGKTAKMVGMTTLAVVTVAAVVALSVAMRGGGSMSGDPFKSLQSGDHPTGSSLWIAPFASPSSTGAHPLLIR
jgi:hypothetical protein